MNLAITQTRSTVGIHAQSVLVEVHLSYGMPYFAIVGLPETAVKESKDRVRSAISNSQFEFPCMRITVNLAPASLPKSGSGFDLPIALGILAASGQIPLNKLEGHEFIGELALNGQLRGVTGIIPVVLGASKASHQLIIAAENATEAAVASKNHVHLAHTLREVCNYLIQDTPLTCLSKEPMISRKTSDLDWSDIKGQFHAKRALEIAACGGHSLLLSGPPGSGKTMLAKRFVTLLPDLSEEHALECAVIRSIREKNQDFTNWREPPFRSPHHTASTVALVGGGNPPKPGEISLAHHGVLFLDELPEFNRHVLETLREPLESGLICISRAGIQTEFPAHFQLIAAMNPCPCGQWGNPLANCLCSPDRINRYLMKLSGPLIDRIDMQICVQSLPEEELLKKNTQTQNESLRIRNEVEKVQSLQRKRQGCLNANLMGKQCETVCQLGHEAYGFLTGALKKLKLSARAYHRLLKVGRTLADMDFREQVTLVDLQKALSFRQQLKFAEA